MKKDSDFLWLISFSDLLLLLFVFFVVMFSFSYQKLTESDLQNIRSTITGHVASKSALDEIQTKLLKWVVDKKLLESVALEQKQDALIIQIKEKLLFNSGNFELKEESLDTIADLSRALEMIPGPYRIGIEGHTDDSPVGKGRDGVQDNWDLSTRRALEVLKALNLKGEVLKRTVVMGYGEMNPLVPNQDREGRKIQANQMKNRRVTIRIF